MSIKSPKENFAANLRKARQNCGISQEELAHRSGLHRTYISSVERGQRNVTLENIFSLAEALGVSPEELVKPISDNETS